MWNLKYDTSEIYKTETDSQTQRTDLWPPRGRGRGRGGVGVWVKQIQTMMYRMGNSKVLLNRTGNYIQ